MNMNLETAHNITWERCEYCVFMDRLMRNICVFLLRVLFFCGMDNIYIRSDPAGNINPDKAKSTEKIDGTVAAIMALDRAIRRGNDNSASVYDSRGLIFI